MIYWNSRFLHNFWVFRFSVQNFSTWRKFMSKIGQNNFKSNQGWNIPKIVDLWFNPFYALQIISIFDFCRYLSLIRKWSFPLGISSVNVTKSAADLVTFTREILNRKLHFLCSVLEMNWIFRKCFEEYHRIKKIQEICAANLTSKNLKHDWLSFKSKIRGETFAWSII